MKSPKLKPLHQPGGGDDKAAGGSPGVMPPPDPANCPACRGRHVAHVCGRSKDALVKNGISPSASLYKETMSPSPTSKAASPKAAKQPAAAAKSKAKPQPKPQPQAKPQPKAKPSKVAAKPKPKPAPKRKAAEMDDDDDGEEHPTVRVVVGNTAKFLREEEGKKFYEWTVFARAEPVYDSSSDEESDEEDEEATKRPPVVKAEGNEAATKETGTAATAASGTADTDASPKSGAPSGSEQDKDPEAAKKATAKAERQKRRDEQRKVADEVAGKFIRRAEFTLHESFRPPVARFNKAPFEVTHEGWGIFALPVLVETTGKRPLRVSHVLAFNKPETKKSYTLDSVTGKLWRPKKTIVVEPRSRPERVRVVAKPKAMQDFVDNNPESVRAARLEKERLDEEEKRKKEQRIRERMEEEEDSEEDEDSEEEEDEEEDSDSEEEESVAKSKASKPRKKHKREEPEDYATWKRQVRHKSDEAPVVSPQWLEHFQQQGGAAVAAPAPERRSSSPRRAVSSFTRPSIAPIKGFNDLDALYYVWPKMHKAISLALERLPPKGSNTTLRVARYFLIQYKRAQDAGGLSARAGGGGGGGGSRMLPPPGSSRMLPPGRGSQQLTTVKNASPGTVDDVLHPNGVEQPAGATRADDDGETGMDEDQPALVEAYIPGGWSLHYSAATVATADEETSAPMDLVPAAESIDEQVATETAAAAPSASSQQLTADDANALDQTAASPGSAGQRPLPSAFPLKLENPESTLVRTGWTTDEAEVVET
jgi:transcription initiation factor IIF auxiliary subunit